MLTLVLTFNLKPNLNFREITGLRQLSLRGVTTIGEKNPLDECHSPFHGAVSAG